jgi:hypothetical protein
MSKKSVHILITNILLLKYANHHLSFQRVVISLLMEGLASMLIIMKMCEILRELQNPNTETRSEHMLLEKWRR